MTPPIINPYNNINRNPRKQKVLTPDEWVKQNEALGYKKVKSAMPKRYPEYMDPKVSYLDLDANGRPIDKPFISYTAPSNAVAIDPNRQPLNLSSPGATVDPNTGNYYSPTTGTQIKPVVQTFNKGGKVKAPGYFLGNEIDDPNNPSVTSQQTLTTQSQGAPITTTGYAANFSAANKKNEQQQKDKAKKRNLSQYSGTAQNLGGAALTVGNQMYTEPENVVDPNAQAQNQAINTGVDSTLSSVTPWYGLAKGASNIGKSQLKKDQYGYTTKGTQRTAEEWMNPFHQSAIQSYQDKDYAGAFRDITGTGTLLRGISKGLEQDERTDGVWGKFNKLTGITKENDKRNANISAIESQGKSLLDAQAAAEAEQKYIAQQGKNATSIGLRNSMQNYKDGGVISGPGTGTSDSIKAKVKPGSFVVPAENAPAGLAIRSMVAPTKKANLNQKNGTNVRLSDGEVLFSPEEKNKVKLMGIDINALAPNSSGTNGYEGGGDVAKRKKEAELKTKQSEYQYLQNRIRENKATPQERIAYAKLGKELGTGSPAKVKGAPKAGPKTSIPNANGLTVWDMKNPGISPSFDNDVPEAQRPVVTPKNTEVTKNMASIEPSGKVNYSLDTTGTGPTNDTITTGTEKKGFDFSKLSKIADYGIPLAQVGMGLNYIKKAGARPVDQLDPDYLRSIETARGNVNMANVNAKFGFSPEEQALIDQQNANLTRSGRADARNMAAGSSSAGLNMERAIINDSFARGLQAKAKNKDLIFQKQQIANDRQQYLDSLVAGKVGMSNRLFDMKLNAWNQQQSTGAGLLNAGLQNTINAKMYQDEITASKDRASRYNVQPVTTI